jgi:CheY-like chemotaxis protein
MELRTLYELFLTEHGFKVQTAVDGRDGLRVAKAFKPDLIFMDIMMPNMDGFQALKILRHDETYGCTKTKIVLLTNLSDAHMSAEIHKDIDGYVVKAEIELSDLLEIIKSLE